RSVGLAERDGAPGGDAQLRVLLAGEGERRRKTVVRKNIVGVDVSEDGALRAVEDCGGGGGVVEGERHSPDGEGVARGRRDAKRCRRLEVCRKPGPERVAVVLDDADAARDGEVLQ